MNTTSSSAHYQQQRIARVQTSCDSHQFFNLLTSDVLFDVLEAQLPDHRERQFPPTETLSMFLAQVMNSDRSCQHIVNDSAVKRLVSGLRGISSHTGGYCRARQRLPLELVTSVKGTHLFFNRLTPRTGINKLDTFTPPGKPAPIP